MSLEVNRPLVTGFPLDRVNLPLLWIPFKYERLGKFWYGCDRLGHEIKNCAKEEIHGAFGNWLRAENCEFQLEIDLVSFRDLNLIESSLAMEARAKVMEEENSGKGPTPLSRHTSAWEGEIQSVLDTWQEIKSRAAKNAGVACKEGSSGLKAKSVVNLVESLHNSGDLTIDRQDLEHYRMDNTNCLVEFESELNSQIVLHEQIVLEK